MVESHRSCYSFTYSRFIPCENSRYAVYGFRTGLTPRPCVWEWGQFAWCNFTSEAVPQSKCSHLACTCFSSSAMHEFQNLHAKSKDKIHDFVRGHFYGWVVAMATTICLIFSSDFMIGNCVLFTVCYVSPLYLHARIHKILCICTHTCTHTYLHIQTHNTYKHTTYICMHVHVYLHSHYDFDLDNTLYFFIAGRWVNSNMFKWGFQDIIGQEWEKWGVRNLQSCADGDETASSLQYSPVISTVFSSNLQYSPVFSSNLQ